MRSMIALKRTRQSGAVLIVAMIILVVLTLLGVTAMNTTSLQERIAANTQEQVHALQAAETGYSQALDDTDAYDIMGTYTGGEIQTAFAGSNDSSSYISSPMGFAPPPLGSGYSVTSFQAAIFNFRVTGQSGSGLTAVINGGAFQIAPKQ